MCAPALPCSHPRPHPYIPRPTLAPPLLRAAIAGHAVLSTLYPQLQSSEYDALLKAQLAALPAIPNAARKSIAALATNLVKTAIGGASAEASEFKWPAKAEAYAYQKVPNQTYALYPQLASAAPLLSTQERLSAIAANRDKAKGPVFAPPSPRVRAPGAWHFAFCSSGGRARGPLHVSPSACMALCMYRPLHAWPSACMALCMYRPLHVSSGNGTSPGSLLAGVLVGGASSEAGPAVCPSARPAPASVAGAPPSPHRTPPTCRHLRAPTTSPRTAWAARPLPTAASTTPTAPCSGPTAPTPAPFRATG
jgi:hypothetical protein